MKDTHNSYIALTRLPELLGYMMNVQVIVDEKKIGEVPDGSLNIFSVESGTRARDPRVLRVSTGNPQKCNRITAAAL